MHTEKYVYYIWHIWQSKMLWSNSYIIHYS